MNNAALGCVLCSSIATKNPAITGRVLCVLTNQVFIAQSFIA